MATLLNVQVRGADAIIAAFDRVGDVAEALVEAAAKASAENIAREASQRVKRRTGATQRGITAEKAHDGKGYVVYVKTEDGMWPNVDIALDFGTVHMTPRPFLHVAAELEEKLFVQRIEQAMETALRGAGF